MKKFIVLFYLLINCWALSAHELMLPLVSSKSTSLPISNNYITIPFFDDFSYYSTLLFPKKSFWKEQGVTLDNNFGINSPTIGVATFDNMDAGGNFYPVETAKSLPMDTLTSLPVRFQDDTEKQNLTLSFAVQPNIFNGSPQKTDSLALQFLIPATDQWVTMWSARIEKLKNKEAQWVIYRFWANDVIRKPLTTEFDINFIPVEKSEFLQNDFRFRFIAFATVNTTSNISGVTGRIAFYHLDIVRLYNKQSEDDIHLEDVAISSSALTLLKSYTAMPWRHFRGSARAQIEQIRYANGYARFHYSINNLASDPVSAKVSINLYPSVSSVSLPQNPLYTTTPNYPRLTNNRDTINLDLIPISIIEIPDTISFKVELKIEEYNTRNPQTSNDVLIFRQNFLDYYAYDDGTAENGYGLFGNGATNTAVAIRFQNYVKDTLRGVWIYFTNSIGNINFKNRFKLAVWKSDENQPGELLYEQINVKPEFTGVNSFVFYPFKKGIVLGEGNFYVGWIQQSEGMLSVGFDQNSHFSGKHYIRTSPNSPWTLSDFDDKGSLMFRPSFRRDVPYNDVDTHVERQQEVFNEILIYPTFTSSHIYFQLPEKNSNDFQFLVYDYMGRLYSIDNQDNAINVSNLHKGKYLLQIVHKPSQQIKITPFIKY